MYVCSVGRKKQQDGFSLGCRRSCPGSVWPGSPFSEMKLFYLKQKFILSDKHLDGAGRSLRHFLDKVKEWHFNSTSNEVIWPKKISNSMHGSKSAILAIFQTGPGWPCTVSAALKNPSQDVKNSFCIWCRLIPFSPACIVGSILIVLQEKIRSV